MALIYIGNGLEGYEVPLFQVAFIADELTWSKYSERQILQFRRDLKSYYLCENQLHPCFVIDELLAFHQSIQNDYKNGENYKLVFEEPEVLW